MCTFKTGTTMFNILLDLFHFKNESEIHLINNNVNLYPLENITLLAPAYVLRREGNVFSSVCLSTAGGGFPDQDSYLPSPPSQDRGTLPPLPVPPFPPSPIPSQNRGTPFPCPLPRARKGPRWFGSVRGMLLRSRRRNVLLTRNILKMITQFILHCYFA